MYPCDIYCVAFKPPSYRWIPPPYYVYAISFTHGCRAQKAMAERHAHTCKFARTHVPGVLLNWHYSLLRYVHTLSPGTVRHVNAPGLLHMSWTWKPITYHIPYHPHHPYPHPNIRILPHTHTQTQDCLHCSVREWVKRVSVNIKSGFKITYPLGERHSSESQRRKSRWPHHVRSHFPPRKGGPKGQRATGMHQRVHLCEAPTELDNKNNLSFTDRTKYWFKYKQENKSLENFIEFDIRTKKRNKSPL